MINILWTVAVILIAFWLLGFVIHLAAALIYPALVIAVIIIAYNVLTGRRAV